MALAHSANAAGERQDLLEHLGNVARDAATFASVWGGEALAEVAGWLHDIGKFNPEFQRYLRESEAGSWAGRHGPDHKGAGAVLLMGMPIDALAFLVQGHHGGLRSRSDLKTWLRERQKDSAVPQAIALAHETLPDLEGRLRAVAGLPASALSEPTALDLSLRMLFSALVDADFLDTERHFQGHREAQRAGDASSTSLSTLLDVFERSQAELVRAADDTPVNRLRHEAFVGAMRRATETPGFFRLTGPTGIGKTRLSLGFALRHAVTHGLERVIYAIPYTSITEQVAREFRGIFGEDGRIVLEHHSAVDPTEPGDTPSRQEMWRRLAAENWQAPLVVTTTVQLFESLFAASPARCRKLHNVARSVVILDEAQMLPAHLLKPMLDVLRQLVRDYGVSVVFCTATQPALDAVLSDLAGVREIIPDPPRFFAALKRVEYVLPPRDERWSWERAAEELGTSARAMAIVNTRTDAVALLDAVRAGGVDERSLFHLSTWMAGAHRRAVLEEVRRRLKRGEPCCLVATQVVEAGVDLDFPLVLRALAPLDRIVQAAGRCNRNGNLPQNRLGRVVVFVPAEGKTPPGTYRMGIEETSILLAEAGLDLHDPEVYERYFRGLFHDLGPDALDKPRVQAARNQRVLDFPVVAERFQMIDHAGMPVVITNEAPGMMRNPARGFLDRLAQGQGNPRELLRQLQPYMVALDSWLLKVAQQRTQVIEVIPGLYQWQGRYDSLRGIVLEGGVDPTRNIW